VFICVVFVARLLGRSSSRPIDANQDLNNLSKHCADGAQTV